MIDAGFTAAVRAATPSALAVLVRRTGSLDDAEDALQEALTDAAAQWPRTGIPREPAAWLVTVAVRRFVDAVRSDTARRDRERRVAAVPSAVAVDRDDTLDLFLLCCHPSLSRASQVALTLRCVGGLTTREIARGLLSTESAVAQRISRAKATLRGVPLASDAPLVDRVPAVLDVLGIIHTESHTAIENDTVMRPALGAEARRLTRMLLAAAAEDARWRAETMGLLSLMLLTDARAPARLDAHGELVPLAEQDRTRWRRDVIVEGTAMLDAALERREVGRYQVRAAIAAVHDAAPSAEATDWGQLLGLYDVLCRMDPGPISELGRAVAAGHAIGPRAGLRLVGDVSATAPTYRVEAVRAHLLALDGRWADASRAYELAARLTRNPTERRWLLRTATTLGDRVAEPPDPPGDILRIP